MNASNLENVLQLFAQFGYYLVDIVATRVSSDHDGLVTIVRLCLDVTDVTMKLSPWLGSALVLVHKGFPCNNNTSCHALSFETL
jgi:hypothetical protein